ncbi:MAG: nickel transport protein [Desulfovibrionales bacterium]|jgi:cobalt/nickel transport protein|nr:nickel transport protein [Desulfovibrionales bacterium]
MYRYLFAALLVLCMSAPAQAHFQMLYTPEAALTKGGELDLKLVFSHPFDAGHTMNMGKPLQFFMINKGKKTDLMKDLKPIKWQSLTNSGDAYEAEVKVRKMGDYVFCLVPEPYFEPEEGAYIQQITKVIINNSGLPTDWDAAVGLPAEIVPLDKPYALWTGNVFRGVVMGDGKPVPDAEIEVEFLNHPPVPGKNMFQKQALATAPQDAFVTLTIKADANGEFAFGLPKAGWWGFAALGVGPLKTYKDKDNSQDAVIWVKAVDMK